MVLGLVPLHTAVPWGAEVLTLLRSPEQSLHFSASWRYLGRPKNLPLLAVVLEIDEGSPDSSTGSEDLVRPRAY